MGLGAGFKQDGRDEESGENEEEIDAGPSPERGLIEEGVFEAGMAVVEDDGEDGDAAESLEFGDVGGEPGWALDGQCSWQSLWVFLDHQRRRDPSLTTPKLFPKSKHRSLGTPLKNTLGAPCTQDDNRGVEMETIGTQSSATSQLAGG